MCDSTRDSPELALITWLSGENLQMWNTLNKSYQLQQTDSDNENYRSLCHQTDNDVTNKNNDVSFEGLDVILTIMSVSTYIAAVILYSLFQISYNVTV